MTSLLTARGQDLAAAFGLHAHAESVRLRATALARLGCTLWQSNPPVVRQNFCPQAVSSALFEFPSVVDPRVHGQENAALGRAREKSRTAKYSSELPVTD